MQQRTLAYAEIDLLEITKDQKDEAKKKLLLELDIEYALSNADM